MGRGGTSELIKLHCADHPDRLVDRFCLVRMEFICGKCSNSDNERKVDRAGLEKCTARIKELLHERMLEIVKENSQPT
jgi:hypothetical protein